MYELTKLNNQPPHLCSIHKTASASSFNFGGILSVHFLTKPIPTNSIHSGPPKNCNVTSITPFISVRPYISIKCFPIHYNLAIIICFFYVIFII